MNASTARQNRVDLLPPERGTVCRRPARSPARPDIVDADFVVIARRDATSNDNRFPSNARPRPRAPLHLAERLLQRLPARAFAGLVAATIVLVFALTGGLAAVYAALPSGEPAAPLGVFDLSARLEDQNGMKVLAVSGRLGNVSGVVQAVPPLDVVIESAGAPVRRRLTLEARVLAPGEGDHFALRIPHAGGKLPKVSVSVAGQDAPAG